MTIEGAIVELQSWIDSEAIPAWAKPSLKKIKETVEDEREEHLWIPVTERLPEEDGDYFTTKIYDSDEPILGMTYYRKEWGWSTSYKITAWMPLPKPYEGSEG